MILCYIISWKIYVLLYCIVEVDFAGESATSQKAPEKQAEPQAGSEGAKAVKDAASDGAVLASKAVSSGAAAAKDAASEGVKAASKAGRCFLAVPATKP